MLNCWRVLSALYNELTVLNASPLLRISFIFTFPFYFEYEFSVRCISIENSFRWEASQICFDAYICFDL